MRPGAIASPYSKKPYVRIPRLAVRPSISSSWRPAETPGNRRRNRPVRSVRGSCSPIARRVSINGRPSSRSAWPASAIVAAGAQDTGARLPLISNPSKHRQAARRLRRRAATRQIEQYDVQQGGAILADIQQQLLAVRRPHGAAPPEAPRSSEPHDNLFPCPIGTYQHALVPRIVRNPLPRGRPSRAESFSELCDLRGLQTEDRDN